MRELNIDFLRKRTYIYFKNLSNYPQKRAFKEKYNYFANIYEKNNIKFYVNESLNHIESKKLDIIVKRMKTNSEPICNINQYIDDINNRNIFGRNLIITS